MKRLFKRKPKTLRFPNGIPRTVVAISADNSSVAAINIDGPLNVYSDEGRSRADD